MQYESSFSNHDNNNSDNNNNDNDIHTITSNDNENNNTQNLLFFGEKAIDLPWKAHYFELGARLEADARLEWFAAATTTTSQLNSTWLQVNRCKQCQALASSSSASSLSSALALNLDLNLNVNSYSDSHLDFPFKQDSQEFSMSSNSDKICSVGAYSNGQTTTTNGWNFAILLSRFERILRASIVTLQAVCGFGSLLLLFILIRVRRSRVSSFFPAKCYH